MSRKEIYQKIQELNLQDAIKAKFGDNYTRIGSDALESFVSHYVAKQHTDVAVQHQESALNKVASAEVESAYEAACLVFLGLLKDNNLLDGLLSKL